MVRHARRRPYPRTQPNTVTLQLRTRPTNVNKLHNTTLGQTKAQLTSTDTDVPATQTTFGDTTTGSSAMEPTQTKPAMRRPRQPRTDHTHLQPPLDRKQTTRKPANTKPARRAWVKTGTASNGFATLWCAAPADDHPTNKTVTLPLHNRPTNINKLRRTVKRPTNQPQQPTSNPRPPGRAQARPSQEV